MIIVNQNSAKVFEKVAFPRISLQKAIDICKVVHAEYGGIVRREELAGICKVKVDTGGFQNIVDALKNSYGLMEKASQSEYKLTELAKQALSEKLYLIEVITRVKPFTFLINRYKGNLSHLPKKAVMRDALRVEFGISDIDSLIIVNKFVRSLNYILTTERVNIDNINKPMIKLKDTNVSSNFELYKNIVDLRAELKLGEKSNDEATDFLEKNKQNLPSIKIESVLNMLLKLEEGEIKKDILILILESLSDSFGK